MLRTLVLVSVLLCSSLLPAQVNDPDWSALMKGSGGDFETVRTLHEQLWQEREITPGCGWKPFKRWEWLMESRLDDNGQMMSGAEVRHRWEELRQLHQSRSLQGNWKQLGPILDDITSRDNIPGVGRTSFIAFHPANAQIIYLGTPAGGLWRSFDGGITWSTNTDNLPTLGVSSILFDPNEPSTIYIGTGDRDAGDAPGMGVMRSTDGGETWEFLNSGMESLTVGDLKWAAGGVLLAGTSNGIYRSTNQGTTWQMVSLNSVDYRDLEVHPTNPNIVYATGAGRFYRSENAGQTWTWITTGITTGSRMVLAVSPVNPDYVYVCSANTYAFKAFYRSTDTGLSFTKMSDAPNILGWSADGSSTGGQAWYDLCMAADHEQSDVVYVGGIRMKKSLDGGATWIDINPNYLHVDQHELAISPHNNDLYLCNDGGIYHYQNNSEWVDISTSLINGQIYKMGQNPHNPNYALTGFQDNGTMEFNGVQWQRAGGGDGFECAYDITTDTWRYGSIYYGDIFRTSPQFINQKICGNEVLGINETGAWSTPFALSYTDPNTMYVGLKNIWRSRNIKEAEKDSIDWVKISNNLGGNNNTNINAFEISLADSNRMYVAKPNMKLWRTDSVNAANPQWLNLSSYLPFYNVPVRAIETNPLDTGLVYIGFRHDVYRSDNGGFTWTDITPDLPNIVVNTIVLDTTGAPEALYIGCDMGVFYKDATMDEWIPFNQGFPLNARVTELEIYYGPTPSESRIRASTYGRGLWESDLYGSETALFPSVPLLTAQQVIGGEVFGNFQVDLSFYKQLNKMAVTDFDSGDLFIENASINGVQLFNNTYTLTVQPQNYGLIKMYVPQAIVTDSDGVLNWYSDTLKVYYLPVPEPFGHRGPGGVGDVQSLCFWLRADMQVYNGNLPAVNDGDVVNRWRDVSGHDYETAQNTESRKPQLRTGENGINQMPALYFDGDDDWLALNGVVPGRSISGYAMVEGDSIGWNDHGWIASARVSNGYLMHPWKGESQYSAEVLALDEQYSGSPVYYIGDASAPHIYGFIYEQDDIHQVFTTVFDEKRFAFPGVNLNERNNSQPIDIRIGWDYEERYGKGKIAEHFLYNRRLFTTHHTLVANYMAAKYAVDLGPLTRYHHPAQPHDVFGIGRETQYDLHTDAQGKGVVRINNATSLDNGDYLLMGDDHQSLTVVNGVYPIMSPRSARTWGYTQTGQCGTVRVQVEKSYFDGLAGVGLIVSPHNEFIPGQPVQFYPLTLNGDYLEAEVQFPASGVFTIGTSPVVGLMEATRAELKVFPNPASGQLMLVLENAWLPQSLVVLRDATGREVLNTRMEGRSMALDVSVLRSGLYTISVILGDEKMIHQRVVVQH